MRTLGSRQAAILTRLRVYSHACLGEHTVFLHAMSIPVRHPENSSRPIITQN